MTDQQVAETAADADLTANDEGPRPVPDPEITQAEEAAGADSSEDKGSEDGEQQKKKPANEHTRRRLQQRKYGKSELKREREARIEAEREAARQRGRAEAFAEMSNRRESTPKDDPEPQYEDFEDMPKYLDARDAWKARQSEGRQHEEKPSKPQDDKTEAAQVPQPTWTQEEHSAFIDKGVKLYGEEFADLVGDKSLPISTPDFAEYLIRSENGPEILAYLSENEREFQRIDGLNPLGQFRALQGLETKAADGSLFAGETDTGNPDTGEQEQAPEANSFQERRVSRAPGPINTERTESSAQNADPIKAAEKGDMSSYIEIRNKQDYG